MHAFYVRRAIVLPGRLGCLLQGGPRLRKIYLARLIDHEEISNRILRSCLEVLCNASIQRHGSLPNSGHCQPPKKICSSGQRTKLESQFAQIELHVLCRMLQL